MMDVWVGGWMVGWMMGRWTDGRTDGWMSARAAEMLRRRAGVGEGCGRSENRAELTRFRWVTRPSLLVCVLRLCLKLPYPKRSLECEECT